MFTQTLAVLLSAYLAFACKPEASQPSDQRGIPQTGPSSSQGSPEGDLASQDTEIILYAAPQSLYDAGRAEEVIATLEGLPPAETLALSSALNQRNDDASLALNGKVYESIWGALDYLGGTYNRYYKVADALESVTFASSAVGAIARKNNVDLTCNMLKHLCYRASEALIEATGPAGSIANIASLPFQKGLTTAPPATIISPALKVGGARVATRRQHAIKNLNEEGYIVLTLKKLHKTFDSLTHASTQVSAGRALRRMLVGNEHVVILERSLERSLAGSLPPSAKVH